MPSCSLYAAALLLVHVAAAPAAVIDRIAVVVGDSVITETEVLQETRLEEFMNQAPLDLGPQARRAAAERLVDQQLIRNEMGIGGYPEPTPAEVDDMLRNFQQEHFGGDMARLRAALEKYGLTEDQLKQHLRWQLAVIRFTDIRFKPVAAAMSQQQAANRAPASAPPSAGDQQSTDQDSANRVATNPPPVPADVDQQLDAWLKQARSNTKVQIKPGAFQ